MQNEEVLIPDERARAKLLEQKEVMRPRRTFWQDAWYNFRHRKVALIGLYVFIFLVASVAFGPFLYKVSHSHIDFKEKLLLPGSGHILGTNEMGQDTLARILFGGRTSIAVGIFAMMVSMTVGTLVGAISGFFGGAIDNILMRITELFIAIPTLPFLLVVTYLFREPVRKALGPETGVFVLIVLVIGLLHWMTVARLVRASVLSIRELEFVTAARSMGAAPWRLIRKHILPNVMSPVIVAATLAVGSAIIQESTLSFLGLGFPPDTPTWGRMLNEARNYLDSYPMLAIIPGTMIFLIVLSINAVGDGLRDALDPRLGSGKKSS